MSNSFWDKRRIGFAIAVSSAIVFGFWPSAVRGVYANGGNVVFTLLLTTWVRALCMGGFCLLKRLPLFQSREDTKQAIIGGFFQAVCVIGLYAALVFLPGPLVIIILFSHTLMLLFYMAWRREIKLDRITVGTTLIALGGLSMVLNLWHTQTQGNIWGILLAFVGALATVSRLYVYGHETKTRHPIVVGAENFLLAAFFMMVVLFYDLPQAPTNVVGVAYAASGSLALTIGTMGMFYGISFLGSFQWSLFLKLEPVFTALFAALFLKEYLKSGQYIGILIVVSSLVFYQIVDHRRRRAILNQDEIIIQ